MLLLGPQDIWASHFAMLDSLPSLYCVICSDYFLIYANQALQLYIFMLFSHSTNDIVSFDVAGGATVAATVVACFV